MQIRSMVVFPGQGAQYTGMLGRLSGDYDKAEYFVKTASEISGLDLSELCERAGEDELTLTHNAQRIMNCLLYFLQATVLGKYPP